MGVVVVEIFGGGVLSSYSKLYSTMLKCAILIHVQFSLSAEI